MLKVSLPDFAHGDLNGGAQNRLDANVDEILKQTAACYGPLDARMSMRGSLPDLLHKCNIRIDEACDGYARQL